MAVQVSTDPRVKAQLALRPPPNSGSFSPSAAGSSGPGFPCRRSPLFLQPGWLLLSIPTKAQLVFGVYASIKVDLIPLLLQEALGKSSWLL